MKARHWGPESAYDGVYATVDGECLTDEAVVFERSFEYLDRRMFTEFDWHFVRRTSIYDDSMISF